MTIHVVVYVGDGIIHQVEAFKTAEGAQELRRAILKEEGCSIEQWGFTDPAKYTEETGDELTEIDGKHYYVNEADCLHIYELDAR